MASVASVVRDRRSGNHSLTTNLVNTVVISGGTHGNERNGVYLAKHFMANPQLVTRPSFKTTTLLANMDAVAKNLRYVDQDLNRSFLLSELGNPNIRANSEVTRALELNALLGPKDSYTPATDFLIDLHNTTSNTGVALMMAPDDSFAHSCGKYLLSLDSSIRIVEWLDQPDWGLFPTIAKSGLTFEVGPCPWGCVEGASFMQSQTLLVALLDYVEKHNQAIHAAKTSADGVLTTPESVEVFQRYSEIDYPRDASGELIGMVHPTLQAKGDFQAISPGDPLFLKFTGEEVLFTDPILSDGLGHVFYPFFVNEAAYYEKKIAMILGIKKVVTFASLRV